MDGSKTMGSRWHLVLIALAVACHSKPAARSDTTHLYTSSPDAGVTRVESPDAGPCVPPTQANCDENPNLCSVMKCGVTVHCSCGRRPIDPDEPQTAVWKDGVCIPPSGRVLCAGDNGYMGSRCEVETGCPGKSVTCGCQLGLTCQSGTCQPTHRPCDPIGPRDACRGNVCGVQSNGCGGQVQCGCAAGKTCVANRCQ